LLVRTEYYPLKLLATLAAFEFKDRHIESSLLTTATGMTEIVEFSRGSEYAGLD
jgi:hypothetical protein